MFEKIKPLGDRVLVKLMQADERTPSGLFIPDSAAKEKAQTGTVVAIGSGKKDKDGKHIPLDVAVNDVVYFPKYAGTEAGDTFLIVREDEILGVVQK